MDNIIYAWNYIKLWWEIEKAPTKTEMPQEMSYGEFDKHVKYAGGCPSFNSEIS